MLFFCKSVNSGTAFALGSIDSTGYGLVSLFMQQEMTRFKTFPWLILHFIKLVLTDHILDFSGM